MKTQEQITAKIKQLIVLRDREPAGCNQWHLIDAAIMALRWTLGWE